MRPVRFLLPGTSGRFRCGGLLVELQTARLVSQIAPVQVVPYRQREAEYPFLDDLLRAEPLGRQDPAAAPLWIVSWGFNLPSIEVLACGCVVFSSFNHALADSLDPGRLGHQLGFGTLVAGTGGTGGPLEQPRIV